MFRALITSLPAFLMIAVFAQAAEKSKTTPAGIEFFERKIRPVLVKHCLKCHSAKSKPPKGGLRLDTIAGILRGGDNGAPFDAKNKKDASKSLLFQAVSYSGDFVDMPPSGKLPARVIADFKRWIEMGAPMPQAKSTGDPKPQKSVDIAAGKKFWSFQPVKSLPAPKVTLKNWSRRKIDRFILRKLEANSLSPSPETDRRTFFRRVSLDLTGLPPTLAEIRAFERDRSPKAYEKVVERLLASPRYGERWGRHWLDIARYAEDNPTSESTCKPPRYPWPYRDWVIHALNDDLPYDEFVRRQLAADLMPHLPPGEIAATGFLGLSPVYHKEPKLSRDVILQITADEWDERIDTISRGLLGLTVACARCHDHKFDPIKREDYYALAGVMASTQQVEWPLVKVDPKVASQITDTRLAIVDYELRVSYAKAMLETAKEKNQPTEQHARKHKRLQKHLEELKKRKLFTGPIVNGVRDAALRVNGDDPDWTESQFRPGEGRNVPLFIRGSVTTPGKIVPRRFLEVLSKGTPQPFQQGSGRLELANRIFDDAKHLAARVMVNRVWGWHFGQPLVRTPSNFGMLGDRPSHPQLLDDLAARFIQNGWSLKWLHREIVLSATYRQSSRITSRPKSNSSNNKTMVNPQTIDPDNRLLSRMNRRRLEPEVWRDTVLFVSGQLNLKMGGPSEDLDKPNSRRRSVYGKVSRQKPADILRLWDFPDAKFHADRRIPTTTPIQQLYLLNSQFLRDRAKHIVSEHAKKTKTSDFIRAVFLQVLQRKPTNSELQAAKSLLAGNALENRRLLVHSLLASNEFLFVD